MVLPGGCAIGARPVDLHLQVHRPAPSPQPPVGSLGAHVSWWVATGAILQGQVHYSPNSKRRYGGIPPAVSTLTAPRFFSCVIPQGLRALGAHVEVQDGVVVATAPSQHGGERRLVGGAVRLSFPSVGATETILMAAALAQVRAPAVWSQSDRPQCHTTLTPHSLTGRGCG